MAHTKTIFLRVSNQTYAAVALLAGVETRTAPNWVLALIEREVGRRTVVIDGRPKIRSGR